MTDHLAPGERSKNMAAIKGQDTAPEVAVQRLARRLGYRFQLRRKDLPGKPDVVFPGARAAIYVHGCFWHQHASSTCKARPPKSNRKYWLPKLLRNVVRDRKNLRALRRQGWRVMVVWECQTQDRDKLAKRLVRFLSPRKGISRSQ